MRVKPSNNKPSSIPICDKVSQNAKCFEEGLDPNLRRQNGVHFSSEALILNLIGALFLAELTQELEHKRSSPCELLKLQDKIASVHILDPASGCGNFLIYSYKALRELEFEILKSLSPLLQAQGDNITALRSKISLSQFSGMERDKRACDLAQISLFQSKQLFDELLEQYFINQSVLLDTCDRAQIYCGNALALDWSRFFSSNQLSYIVGNPPYIGARLMSPSQKEELRSVFSNLRGVNDLDYVSAWFMKAAHYMQRLPIRTAFIATSSICQGSQCATLWQPILKQMGLEIDFAYSSFKWMGETKSEALVHCVIVGFSSKETPSKGVKKIYLPDASVKEVKQINAYLEDGSDVFIKSRQKPLSDVKAMVFGSMANDGGHLLLTENEYKTLVSSEAKAEKYIRPFIGAHEFIHSKRRFCLWIHDDDAKEAGEIAYIKKRFEAVSAYRLKSSRKATRKRANSPHAFAEIRQPHSNYLLVPRVSTQQRSYLPIGFVDESFIASDATLILPDADLFSFAVLSSSAHNAWMRTICGRLGEAYRYSAKIVYNNFPWPAPDALQMQKINESANAILEVRASCADKTIDELYHAEFMPEILKKAHKNNDLAIWEAYGRAWLWGDETSCVASLLDLYSLNLARKN